jgi:hypothetical protein
MSDTPEGMNLKKEEEELIRIITETWTEILDDYYWGWNLTPDPTDTPKQEPEKPK